MPYQSIFKDGLFAGRTIIVTGGGSGIGRCTAHELAHLGARVVITGRSQEKLDRVAAEITEVGGKVATASFDIRDEEAVRENIAAILKEHGPVTGLVNNAGGQFPAALEDISLKGWEAVVKNNLTGGFLVSRELVTQGMKHSGGAIVNMMADFWRSMPRMGHSGAARAGMENFTRTAAIEWAHYGIRVNGVAPGSIASSGLDTYPTSFKRAYFERIRQMPLRRLGTESEVSAAIVFLLSDAAGFISGDTIRIDGAVPNVTNTWQVPDHNNSKPFDGFHLASHPKFLEEGEEALPDD